MTQKTTQSEKRTAETARKTQESQHGTMLCVDCDRKAEPHSCYCRDCEDALYA